MVTDMDLFFLIFTEELRIFHKTLKKITLWISMARLWGKKTGIKKEKIRMAESM